MLKLLKGLARKRALLDCSVIVVAAGSARRMEGIDKILAPLGGVPLLLHSLRAFQRCEDVAEIVVVTREDLLVEIGNICKDNSLYKASKIVVGGETRTLSVRAGLRAVRPSAELIAIHDGARPFLTDELLHDVLHTAARTGAAAPAVPVTDTVKRVEGDTVLETVDRDALRAVQTPQVFQSDLIRAAIEKAIRDEAAPTDDCCAVERLGMKVALTSGDKRNIKITTPVDLLIGEALLEVERT